ncbi:MULTISPECIES: ABC transporter ATP-binding protein [Nocardiaceae]|uniref:ABC transporter ATP-binding protein n=1 Tax=Nocardiaceae TaxID=85025 RepID=UPI0003A7C3B5|nr:MULTISPECIES: ABC transporter ATP-binding protein [Rhodococcus]
MNPPSVSLLDFLRPVRGRLVAGAVLAALSGAAAVVPFVAVAEAGRSLLGADPDAVWWWTLVGIGGAVARILLYGVATVLCHYADADFRAITRRSIVEVLAAAPLGWFGDAGSSEVDKAVSDDVKRMHVIVAHSVAELAGTVVTPVVASIYLFLVDWRMAALVVGFVVIAFILVSPPMRTTFRKYMGAYNTALADAARSTVELVDGIEVVKAYGRGTEVFSRFTSSVDRLTDICRTWMKGTGGPVTVLTVLYSPAVLIVWILATGSVLVASDSLEPVDLLPFLAVGVGLPGPFMNLTQIAGSISSASVAAAHVGTVLATPPLPPSEHPASPVGSSVEFSDVVFAYGDGPDAHVALRAVNLVMEPGTVTALVGPSGSGKTTVARLVPRFWDVSGGAVRIGGVDVRDIDQAQLLSDVAVVFQDAQVLRDTVRENIRLARPEAGDDAVEAAARAAYIHDRITELPDGYDTVLGSSGSGLSGGELQRITIARAVLQDAKILVLDEATAHADPHSEARIQRALSTLVAGRTVLVIAHRLETIRDADSIVVLEGGRVVEQGTHDELDALGGRYRQMRVAAGAR